MEYYMRMKSPNVIEKFYYALAIHISQKINFEMGKGREIIDKLELILH